MEKKTLTPMLQKLRDYLANTPTEQIKRDWNSIKSEGPANGPTAREFIRSFKSLSAEESLLDIKLQLYSALLQKGKNPETLSETETRILFELSKDSQVQLYLTKK